MEEDQERPQCGVFPTTLKVIQKQAKKGRLWLKDGSCVQLLPESPNHVSPASPNPTCSARTGPPPAHFARFACHPWCRTNSFSQLMKSERENTTLKPTILVLIRQILTVEGISRVAKGAV